MDDFNPGFQRCTEDATPPSVNKVKLIDFGIAVILATELAAPSVSEPMGSLEYLAPEVGGTVGRPNTPQCLSRPVPSDARTSS